jgi:hypothetical protein
VERGEWEGEQYGGGEREWRGSKKILEFLNDYSEVIGYKW